MDLVSFKFLVSEDLRGTAADERLASGSFSVPEACRLVRMTAVGLAQMHQFGRVHGDLRPRTYGWKTPRRKTPAISSSSSSLISLRSR